MSNPSRTLIENLKAVAIINPSMQFHNSGTFGVKIGNRQYTPTVYPTTSFSTTGGPTTWQIRPPNEATAIERDSLRTKFYVDIQFTGTIGANGKFLNIGLWDAARAFPIAQVTQSVSVVLGQNTVSMQTYLLINALSRCNTGNDDLSFKTSDMPTALDQNTLYSDPYLNDGTLNPALLQSNMIGTVNDPMQSYGQSVGKYSGNRGGFPYQILSNTTGAPGSAGSARVRFVTCEPLYLSPFNLGTEENFSLVGLNNLNVTLNLSGDLKRVWSHSNHPDASIITTMLVSFYQNPDLEVTWLSSSLLVSVPRQVLIPYNPIQIYTVDYTNTVAAGAAFTVNTLAVNLKNIQSRILVYAQRSPSTTTFTTTDTFATLTGIAIDYGNQSGRLSGASATQLWRMSQRNGYMGSWADWSSGFGSVMILDTTDNLTLDEPGEAPSTISDKQIQIRCSFVNQSIDPTPIQYTLYMVVIGSGVIVIKDGQTELQEAVLTRYDVANALTSGNTPIVEKRSDNMYGGSIGSTFKKFNNVLKSTKAISRIGNELAKYTPNPALAKLAVSAAQQAGYGFYGRGFEGGKVLTTEKLRKRMREAQEDSDDE
jgi:hypothetical protein